MKQSRIVRTALALVTITGFVTACVSYEDTDPQPGGFGPNFSEIQANVFTPTCATVGCHVGVTASQGLNLEAANSYAELVGVASSQAVGILQVAANDPNNSYLIQKMEGIAVAGAVMPTGGALPQATIDIVRQWITDGAIDDRVQSSTPIRVSSVSPMSGANLSAVPTQIIVGFDRELDASTVNANTFILEASGGDTTFGDGNEVQIAAALISVPIANPQTAVFDLTGVIVADDTYRIRLLGLGASIIMDLDANAPDGEFAGVLPSGNGTAGGDFQATFVISTTIVLGPTLSQIQAVVFTPSCATVGCHAGVGAAAGLNLETGNSFAELVGVASSQVPVILQVAANDPNNSYLIQKMEATAIVGGVMPPAGALPQLTIDVVRQWITDGALP